MRRRIFIDRGDFVYPGAAGAPVDFTVLPDGTEFVLTERGILVTSSGDLIALPLGRSGAPPVGLLEPPSRDCGMIPAVFPDRKIVLYYPGDYRSEEFVPKRDSSAIFAPINIDMGGLTVIRVCRGYNGVHYAVAIDPKGTFMFAVPFGHIYTEDLLGIIDEPIPESSSANITYLPPPSGGDPPCFTECGLYSCIVRHGIGAVVYRGQLGKGRMAFDILNFGIDPGAAVGPRIGKIYTAVADNIVFYAAYFRSGKEKHGNGRISGDGVSEGYTAGFTRIAAYRFDTVAPPVAVFDVEGRAVGSDGRVFVFAEHDGTSGRRITVPRVGPDGIPSDPISIMSFLPEDPKGVLSRADRIAVYFGSTEEGFSVNIFDLSEVM